MFKNYPFYFSFFKKSFSSEENISLLKSQDYEKCIKFHVYYCKKAIPLPRPRVRLYAGKILSRTEVNSGKIQLKLVAGARQTLSWTGQRLPVKDGKAWVSC